MVNVKQLRRLSLVQSLSAPRRTKLLASARLAQFEKGVTIFRQGERAQAMWIVLSGWVHLVRSADHQQPARSVVIYTVTSRDALCGISSIDAGSYHLSAIAGTACHAVRIPSEILHEALTHEPRFAYEVLRLCTRRLRHIAQQYGAMAEPVSHRVVRAILRLHQQFGATLPVTHRELAQMAWTTTESAIRIVRRLKADGYLSGTRGRLLVQKPAILEQFLQQANGHGSRRGAVSTYD